jgi:hypothetical protein
MHCPLFLTFFQPGWLKRRAFYFIHIVFLLKSTGEITCFSYPEESVMYYENRICIELRAKNKLPVRVFPRFWE